MSLLSRITTWAAGQLLKSADLNGEFNNIVNTLNNLDAGTTTWTNVKVTTLLPQGNVAMGGFKLTGLGAGSTAGDSIRYEQVNGFRVLQVVSNSTVTASSSTSTSFTDSNLSVTITPASTSNKILLISSFVGSIVNGAARTDTASFTLANGSTNLMGSGGQQEIFTSTAAQQINLPTVLLAYDSPATVSAITYKVRYKITNASSSVGMGDTNVTQYIIAAEIG